MASFTVLPLELQQDILISALWQANKITILSRSQCVYQHNGRYRILHYSGSFDSTFKGVSVDLRTLVRRIARACKCKRPLPESIVARILYWVDPAEEPLPVDEVTFTTSSGKEPFPFPKFPASEDIASDRKSFMVRYSSQSVELARSLMHVGGSFKNVAKPVMAMLFKRLCVHDRMYNNAETPSGSRDHARFFRAEMMFLTELCHLTSTDLRNVEKPEWMSPSKVEYWTGINQIHSYI